MSNGERLKAKKSIFFNYSIQVNSLNKTSADAITRPSVLEVIFIDCRGFHVFERTKFKSFEGSRVGIYYLADRPNDDDISLPCLVH